MPSKEARAYNWSLRIPFKNLIGAQALSCNQSIARDAEDALYLPIRGMIENVHCFSKSHHRLDKFHLLSKEWKDNVSSKLTDDEPRKIANTLLLMLGDMFDYVESKNEMNYSFNNFDKYYRRIKSSLKSDYVNEAIEKIVIALENKLQFVAHYNFMSVSTFGFLGDSIVEACNSAMKTGSVKVATNMTINLSGTTQIKITENQTKNR